MHHAHREEAQSQSTGRDLPTRLSCQTAAASWQGAPAFGFPLRPRRTSRAPARTGDTPAPLAPGGPVPDTRAANCRPREAARPGRQRGGPAAPGEPVPAALRNSGARPLLLCLPRHGVPRRLPGAAAQRDRPGGRWWGEGGSKNIGLGGRGTQLPSHRGGGEVSGSRARKPYGRGKGSGEASAAAAPGRTLTLGPSGYCSLFIVPTRGESA